MQWLDTPVTTWKGLSTSGPWLVSFLPQAYPVPLWLSGAANSYPLGPFYFYQVSTLHHILATPAPSFSCSLLVGMERFSWLSKPFKSP